ncbi:MAG: FHA domain-containing protein [Anaerolineaceae bacterium]|jgi:hypothetical protein|nr:FHA domain-containing protein [Anaerolineaceae bacterium]
MKTTKLKSKPIRGAFWGDLLVILLLMAFLLPALPIQAQDNQPALQITSIDNSNFPEIVLEYKGIHLSEDLPTNPADVEIIEDGQSITPSLLEEQYQGMHFAVAINPDSSLSIRGGDSKPYNLAIIDALKTIGPEPENARNNRYSFFSNPEISLVETDDYTAWAALFADFETIPQDLSASLSSLELAVSALDHSSLALDTVLVYVTPYLDYRLLPEFYALIEQVGQLGVKTQVWMVMSPRVLASSYVTDMQTALQNIGGTFTPLTGTEIVPDPRTYMEGKGRTFTAYYQSQIRTSGEFELQVRANFAQSPTLQSSPAVLSLNVQPTRLSFINPIDTLEILYNNDESFQPALLPLEVLIEFPDGYPRSILNSTLFVNGEQITTNSQPPYGSFVLDLAGCVEETELELEVRLQDEFGLQGRTPVQTIALNVLKPENGLEKSWFTSPWLWFALLALAGTIAFLIFKKPFPKKKTAEEEEVKSDPRPDKVAEKAPLSTPLPEKIFGNLTRLDPDQTPSAEKPHLLTKEVTLIGRDPMLANLILENPSIEPLHAEIHFFPDGRIRLTDFNSTSGTYVNFKPVGAHGTALQHADLIHLGTLLFRFNSVTRTQISSPKSDQ